jgi:hypothetical protein
MCNRLKAVALTAPLSTSSRTWRGANGPPPPHHHGASIHFESQHLLVHYTTALTALTAATGTTKARQTQACTMDNVANSTLSGRTAPARAAGMLYYVAR